MKTIASTYKFRPLAFTLACLASLVIMGVIAPMDAVGAYFVGYFFLFFCAIALVFISEKQKKMRYFRAGITLLYLAPALVICMFIAADYIRL